MIVILLGLPGSGKGTQSQFLKDHFNLHYLSTGEMLRQMILDDSEESRKLNDYIKSGKLVPSDMINKMVEKFFIINKFDNDYLLDGYPRNVEQARFLSSITETKIKVIYFKVNEEIVIKRISGRFNCTNCGKIYNEWYDNTLVRNVCDICHGEHFTYREDDKADIVLKRITEHKKEIFPLVEYYRSLDILHIINADKNKENLSEELADVLKMI